MPRQLLLVAAAAPGRVVEEIALKLSLRLLTDQLACHAIFDGVLPTLGEWHDALGLNHQEGVVGVVAYLDEHALVRGGDHLQGGSSRRKGNGDNGKSWASHDFM